MTIEEKKNKTEARRAKEKGNEMQGKTTDSSLTGSVWLRGRVGRPMSGVGGRVRGRVGGAGAVHTTAVVVVVT